MSNKPKHRIFDLIADLEDVLVEGGDALPLYEATEVLKRLGEMTAMCAEMLHDRCGRPIQR
jgi:hypothetical protein